MGASFITLGSEIQTTDGASTDIGAFDAPPNSTTIVDITVIARALDGTSKVFFHKSTLDMGIQVLTLVNNLQNTIGDTGATLWAFTVNVNSSNQVQLNATGAAGVTIDWRVEGNVTFFQPEG